MSWTDDVICGSDADPQAGREPDDLFDPATDPGYVRTEDVTE